MLSSYVEVPVYRRFRAAGSRAESWDSPDVGKLIEAALEVGLKQDTSRPIGSLDPAVLGVDSPSDLGHLG